MMLLATRADDNASLASWACEEHHVHDRACSHLERRRDPLRPAARGLAPQPGGVGELDGDEARRAGGANGAETTWRAERVRAIGVRAIKCRARENHRTRAGAHGSA